MFNSYGLRSNRFLISNYGFTMRQNKYNSLNFKVFVNDTADPTQTNRHVKILKLKKDRLNVFLLQHLRANLIVDFAKKLGEKGDEISKRRQARLLVSVPVDIEFEMKVLQTAIGLVSGMLQSKFPTTIEEDK